MRLFADDKEYQGTPEEISTFLNLQRTPVVRPEYKTTFVDDDFVPIVAEASSVREKLAANPLYNPYGGVIPSKESEQDIETKTYIVDSDEDTGVVLA